MNYSTILQPQFSVIVQSGSVNITNNVNVENSNQISDWIDINSNTVNVGEVYYRQSGSWELASIVSDTESESVGVIEQVVPTMSGSLAKIVYKGIIDFSSDESITLAVGQPYYLNTSNGSAANAGPIFLRNTTIEEPLVSKPMFIARSINTALVVNMRGHVNNTQDLIQLNSQPDISCPTNPVIVRILPTIGVFIGPCPPDNFNCSDTSGSFQPFDYAIIRYSWTSSNGSDLDTRTALVGVDPDYDNIPVGWCKESVIQNPSSGNKYLIWGGDNTSPTGDEAVLVDFRSIKSDFPSLANCQIIMSNFWYGERLDGNINISFTTYLGGTMNVVGSDFINVGGILIDQINLLRNVSTQESACIPGDLQAYLYYDFTTKLANIIPAY